ncbi:ErfK/YbiS/YcfS/YnhG family protein [Paenibacillus curdlanolyticus YK9]|uniref:ErfK/YbiS/YcfS/YnhG family protein n=1 Tax=Paenibacillus curdlanolyticus YK9 TaxID=717606 RepID=E0I310_9BACL|nr:L,D-transpeptidase [Paenibacillus curdlanolyticus]EFM12674.1 ErfK/YbiS/YcfS/YnhG family protein [Paenibacillus curdlanolyticus YK9]
MEPIRHAEHLKQYVKKHPDNQMAWYLLGKQYEDQGKAAKANYCFMQAGHVYEAFEQRLNPVDEAQAQIQAQAAHAIAWLRKARIRRLWYRTATVAALLLFLVVAWPIGKFSDEDSQEPHARPMDAAAVGVVFVQSKEAGELGEAMHQLSVGERRAALGITARLQPLDGWRNWNGNTALLFAVQRLPAGGVVKMSWYESRLCDCEPADATSAYAAYAEWSQEQEQRWTLGSGIRHYFARSGRWPSSLDDLTKPYPNNMISGDTPLMKAMFNQVLEDAKDEQKQSGSDGKQGAGGGTGASQGQGNGSKNGQGTSSGDQSKLSLSNEPLRIIVDKSVHRLAVVSGDVLVRSYKIGLGGGRTPEGEFNISEKVENPNGRSDGPFGSRGMTLSNTRYAIHGTDEPQSLGGDESLGCIRMSREDVEELYDLVPLGTRVTIQKGGLPDDVSVPDSRFRLDPKQDETNPRGVYAWLD